ncbi:MAG: hypothetical protein JNK63_08770 [Chthonomonas sp.]|nr:hypothetical protein [Chthonomonas sp.]
MKGAIHTHSSLLTGSLIPLTKVNPPTVDGEALIYDIQVSAVSIDGNVNFPVVATMDGSQVSGALEEIYVNGTKFEFDKEAAQIALRLNFTTTNRTAKVRFVPRRGSTTTAVLIHTNTSTGNNYVSGQIRRPVAAE